MAQSSLPTRAYEPNPKHRSTPSGDTRNRGVLCQHCATLVTWNVCGCCNNCCDHVCCDTGDAS